MERTFNCQVSCNVKNITLKYLCHPQGIHVYKMIQYALELLSHSLSSTSSSSSDEELFVRIPKKRQKIVKMQSYVEVTVPMYTSKTFQEHYRMNRSTAYAFIERLERSGYIPVYESGRTNISAEKAFLLTLWYLGNRESFRQISDRFDVSLSSAHRCLGRVIDYILSIRREYIKWPSPRGADAIARKFQRKRNIDNVLGAIDGCHVKINRPRTEQDSYINRKGFHSVLIQGIVDPRKYFLDVYCGEPGSLHDARLLRKSAVYRKAENPDYFGNKFLLGDSAYPSLSWLVPPFKDNGALTNNQKIFNYRHSGTRIVVEHAYGLLKGRFRRLMHFENINILFIVKCIMAACVLHNICILQNDNTNVDIPDISDDLQSEPCAVVTTLSKRDSRREEVFREMFRHNR